MDFGAIPPETNSARIYIGPGSAPMLAAASAWSGLAAELRSAAAGYQSEISGLTGEGWLGPAATRMATAAAPYLRWLEMTAAQAEHTSAQARAAATAFEEAHAMTVPPAAVTANRSQMVSLVSTNFLGQNTPAIAATEANYGQMWAQDAIAMYGYAANSAAATRVVPFAEPPQTVNPTGQANQGAAVNQAAGASAASGSESALSQMVSSMPNALQSLSSPLEAVSGAEALIPPGEVLNGFTNLMSSSFSPMGVAGITQLGADMAVIHSVANGGVVSPFGGVIPGWGEGLLSPSGIGPELLTPGSGISAVSPGGMGMMGLAGQVSPNGAASAAMGRGSLIGALSVPQGWAAATPLAAPPATASTALVSSWTSAPPAAAAAGSPGMPGMPLAGAGSGGRGYGFAAPRYGFKPTIMGRPVVAG